jgi:TPP-dependent pyruvate/acetoin dehydrogenase alpha subunit
MAKDPIQTHRRSMIASGILTEEEATRIENDVKQQVADSIEFARNGTPPAPDAGLEHVYASGRVAASQFVA